MLSASMLTACSDDEFSGDPAKDWAGTTTFSLPQMHRASAPTTCPQ